MTATTASGVKIATAPTAFLRNRLAVLENNTATRTSDEAISIRLELQRRGAR